MFLFVTLTGTRGAGRPCLGDSLSRSDQLGFRALTVEPRVTGVLTDTIHALPTMSKKDVHSLSHGLLTVQRCMYGGEDGRCSL